MSLAMLAQEGGSMLNPLCNKGSKSSFFKDATFKCSNIFSLSRVSYALGGTDCTSDFHYESEHVKAFVARRERLKMGQETAPKFNYKLMANLFADERKLMLLNELLLQYFKSLDLFELTFKEDFVDISKTNSFKWQHGALIAWQNAITNNEPMLSNIKASDASINHESDVVAKALVDEGKSLDSDAPLEEDSLKDAAKATWFDIDSAPYGYDLAYCELCEKDGHTKVRRVFVKRMAKLMFNESAELHKISHKAKTAVKKDYAAANPFLSLSFGAATSTFERLQCLKSWALNYECESSLDSKRAYAWGTSFLKVPGLTYVEAQLKRRQGKKVYSDGLALNQERLKSMAIEARLYQEAPHYVLRDIALKDFHEFREERDLSSSDFRFSHAQEYVFNDLLRLRKALKQKNERDCELNEALIFKTIRYERLYDGNINVPLVVALHENMQSFLGLKHSPKIKALSKVYNHATTDAASNATAETVVATGAVAFAGTSDASSAAAGAETAATDPSDAAAANEVKADRRNCACKAGVKSDAGFGRHVARLQSGSSLMPELDMVLFMIEALEKGEAFWVRCSCGNHYIALNPLLVGEAVMQHCPHCDEEASLQFACVMYQ